MTAILKATWVVFAVLAALSAVFLFTKIIFYSRHGSYTGNNPGLLFAGTVVTLFFAAIAIGARWGATRVQRTKDVSDR